ncbi:peroxide stress protein YaaA [Bifidobacterium sp. ESL0704]|uniref:YaaA family protein n=1 Tax=Bifidobacterium sp. ESL0704 TaxID=2983219 RepID=UPI0023F8C8C5|nr:peroxide stress protein YaaA [Bifidobacterium sp. ESL0704]WEV52383.1 peroxide stress protein YaaA [Bifidobacterium sp. ESL0704]
MHLLLPPSEGKTAPTEGPTLDLGRLSFPELNRARGKVLSALLEVSRGEDAAKILKVGKKGMAEVISQRDLPGMPCARARQIYTGVLYDAAALREGDDVLIFSGLFGVTRGEDLIPAYRLSMNVSLPGIGTLKTFWRKALAGWSPDGGSAGKPGIFKQADTDKVMGARANQQTSESDASDNADITVDLRSELYRVTKSDPSKANAQWWDVRIADSRNKTISHMAKHYRGLLTRALLDAPTRPVAEVARTLGTVAIETESDVRHLTLVPFGL